MNTPLITGIVLVCAAGILLLKIVEAGLKRKRP